LPPSDNSITINNNNNAFETSVNIYQNTLCHNPENCCINSHCHEIIKYYDHRQQNVHTEEQMCTNTQR